MDRRTALAKATIDRTVAAGGLLPPGVSRKFIQVMKEKSIWGSKIDLSIVGEPEGTIKKITSGSRLIRSAAENSDDGYRAQVTFPEVPYATKKLRLPWEVTEDVFHENIEGQSLEATIVDEMATQFGLDLDDLEVNGDTANAGPDAAFLTINNGVLKLAETGVGVHRIDGSTINTGEIDKAHFFAMVQAMPNKYRAGAELWMSPGRKISWLEAMTERATAAGDAVIMGGDAFDKPLGIKINEVPFLPDTRILYSSPRNFVRVVSWQIRKKRVTGETDWELATRDKRGYIYFLKSDFIVRENDALVDLHTLDAI
jgi:HK97 family phage major capsid protein